MENKNIMDYETVELDDQENALVIIDQTKLPGQDRDHTGENGSWRCGTLFTSFR